MLRSLAANSFRKAHLWSSALGQRLGWEWLIYNPLVRYSFYRGERKNAPKMVEAVLREYPGLGSIADVGCGQGIYAAEFQNRGIRVVGCEYAESGRRASRRRGVEVYPFDLSQPQDALPGVPYDAAVTIEVGEHIPQHLAHSFVAYLTSTSNLVIFTAAAPGQGGHGHINEQPKSYWVAMFRSAGFDWDARATDRVGETLRSLDAFHILYDNLLILRRTN